MKFYLFLCVFFVPFLRFGLSADHVMLEKNIKNASLSSSCCVTNQFNPIKLAWEGSFFDLGSLSNVNRFFIKELSKNNELDISCINSRNHHCEKFPTSYELKEVVDRLRHESDPGTFITIRHEWPPNWKRPKGKWILIQPWEFGSLPSEWIKNLKNVDQIWVPTVFVKKEYVYSGIDPDKVKVVPNGYDPFRFNTSVVPMTLSTAKKFKFLFVGGTIFRKGPDILLESFLKAFSSKDDVCLVIKDFGGNGPYAGQTFKKQIEDAKKIKNSPEILYIDQEISIEELASLYRACDCFVLPYRGEGFALPVLEAMACGLPVIVTSGGATDDFVSDASGWFIPSRSVSIGSKLGDMDLVKDGWILEPNKEFLVVQLRWIAAHQDIVKKKGYAASEEAKEWTWENSSRKALEYIIEISKSL